MAFQILNSKQLFASVHWEPIMFDSAVQRLISHVKEHWSEMSSKDQGAWQEVFEAFDQMPTKDVREYGGQSRNKVVLGIGSFVTKSPNNEDYPDDEALWGWEALNKLHPHVRLIGHWIEKHRLGLKPPAEAVKKALKWKQRRDNNEYEIKVFDPVEVLAEAESYAIYIPDFHDKGFLDGRGFGGAPLAGARMFETAGSAYTTIASRGLSNAVVVKVKNSLLGLDFKSVANQNCGDILSAVAIMERKRLEKALEDASIEQLRARLATLEEASGEAEIPVEEEAPKRRRM